MSETKIFCSVIVFTLGVYTIILLQYELFKLNNLNTNTTTQSSNVVNQHHHHFCNSTVRKTKFKLERLNCGSAGDLLSLVIQNCTELPCDVLPDVSYTVVLNFIPSRNMSNLEIQTYVRQKKDLIYLHKDMLNTHAIGGSNTTLKFSFTFPAHHLSAPRKKISRCPIQVYLVGVEIWDLPSGIGEVCLVVPINVNNVTL